MLKNCHYICEKCHYQDYSRQQVPDINNERSWPKIILENHYGKGFNR